MPKTKILIVEDDAPLAEVLKYNLQNEGYEVVVAHDGQDGLDQAQLNSPDLVILDIMLPAVDGLEVCRRLRADSATKSILILMLTAKSDETDQVVGFSLGADDFVTKPFSVKVLLERIKALTRRGRDDSAAREDQVRCHGVTLDRHRHRATADDRPLDLTYTEFRILETLIRQAGRVFERAELIDVVLGKDTVVMERTIDVHIRSLRRKLEDKSDVIETVRGVGYRFQDPGGNK